MNARTALVLLLAAMGVPRAPSAQTCNVPVQRPTIQAAVLDPACGVVNVAAGTRTESVSVRRSVTVSGSGTATTVILGRFLVSGAGTVLDLANLTVDARSGTTGCYAAAVVVAPGATTRPSLVAALNGAGGPGPCPLFADSFDFGG